MENVGRRHHPVLGGALRSVEPDKGCEVLSVNNTLDLLFLSLKKDSKESDPSESS